MPGFELIIADAHPDPDLRSQIASTVVQALLTFESDTAGLRGIWLGGIQERDHMHKPDAEDIMLVSDWVTPQHLLDELGTENYKRFRQAVESLYPDAPFPVVYDMNGAVAGCATASVTEVWRVFQEDGKHEAEMICHELQRCLRTSVDHEVPFFYGYSVNAEVRTFAVIIGWASQQVRRELSANPTWKRYHDEFLAIGNASQALASLSSVIIRE